MGAAGFPLIDPDKLFEVFVAAVLRRNGFHSVLPSHLLTGRSDAKHQIDCAGLYSLRIPFVHPIVLISEAKLWADTVDLPVIRNLFGVLNDLREALPNTLAAPRNWPSDLYVKGGITANYLGAVFTNTDFTRRAEAFALSNGIYLIPMQIDSSRIDDLIHKFIELRHERTCPRHCLENITNGWAVLDQLFDEHYSSLTDSDRVALIQIVQSIAENCDKFPDLGGILSSLHLAAVEGIPVMIEIDPESLLSLHSLIFEVEAKKQELKVRELKHKAEKLHRRAHEKPAESEESFDEENGLISSMTVGKAWSSKHEEKNEKSINKGEEPVTIRKATINIPRIDGRASLLLSETVLKGLRERKKATLSIPLSRALLGQLTLKIE